MSDPVRYILVEGGIPVQVTFQAITIDYQPVTYDLPNPLPAGAEDVTNDLSTLKGLESGTALQIKITKEGTSPKTLTYNSDSQKYAIYAIEGTPGSFELVFKNIVG